MLAGLLLFAATTAAPPAEPRSIEQRLVAVVTHSDPGFDKKAALSLIAREPLTARQQIDLKAFRTMVDGWSKSDEQAVTDIRDMVDDNPASGGAKIALSYALGRVSQAEQATDALVEGLKAEPALVDAVSASHAETLLAVIQMHQDYRRTRTLAHALFEAGWKKGDPDTRSFLASELILDELERGDVAAARKWLGDVSDPQHLYELLADKRFEPLAAESRERFGTHLETSWRNLLVAARDEWSASDGRDGNAAASYAQALLRSGQDQSVVDQFLPRFVRGYNCPNDPSARAVMTPLVDSLVRLGQPGKANSVLGRAVNYGGRYNAGYLSLYYLSRARFDDAATLIEAALAAIAKSDAKAKFPTDEIIITLLRSRLVCAKYRRGSTVEAVATDRLSLGARLWLARCLDQPDQARSMLIAALGDADQRRDALAFMQPDSPEPRPSIFDTAMRASADSLRQDPQVRAATARVGTIHDWPVEAGAPRDLAPAKPRRPAPCGDYRPEINKSDPPEDLYEKRKPM